MNKVKRSPKLKSAQQIAAADSGYAPEGGEAVMGLLGGGYLKTDYQLVQLRTRDDHLLSELDTLHREFFRNSPVPPKQFMDFVRERLADDEMLLVLAVSDDRAVGYGLAFDVSEHPFMPEWQRSGYITQLYVTPEHRGRGVGQRMVDLILAWMRSRGIQSVQLNAVASETGAQEFWHKQGFEPCRVRMRRGIQKSGLVYEDSNPSAA